MLFKHYFGYSFLLLRDIAKISFIGFICFYLWVILDCQGIVSCVPLVSFMIFFLLFLNLIMKIIINVVFLYLYLLIKPFKVDVKVLHVHALTCLGL